MDSITLTGKTRFRTLHRGIWPLRSAKLVLQVEVQHRVEIVPDFYNGRDKKEVCNHFYWRDAKFEDLTVSDKRELFCRENPR